MRARRGLLRRPSGLQEAVERALGVLAPGFSSLLGLSGEILPALVAQPRPEVAAHQVLARDPPLFDADRQELLDRAGHAV